MTLERSLLRTLERALERTTQRDANTRECNTREEKRREMVGSPSIHNVTQVTRKATPEQPLIPSDAWMEAIDLWVDLEAEVPCEVSKHDHSAELLVTTHHHACGYIRTGGMCRAWWAYLGSFDGCRCPGCGDSGTHRDDFARIVEVLR